jgi:hypothetical protein
VKTAAFPVLPAGRLLAKLESSSRTRTTKGAEENLARWHPPRRSSLPREPRHSCLSNSPPRKRDETTDMFVYAGAG